MAASTMISAPGGISTLDTVPDKPMLAPQSDINLDQLAPIAPTKTSPFFKLPAELREQIYYYLLTSPRFSHNAIIRRANSAASFGSSSSSSSYSSSYSSISSNSSSSDNNNIDERPIHPSLLSTCRLINTEATPIFYGNNTYTAHYRMLDSAPHLYISTKPIHGARPISMIRHWRIEVRLDCDTVYPAEAVSAAFTGAESLEVEASQAMFRAADYGNLLKFRGVRGVKQTRVWGSVEREFACALEECMRRPVRKEGEMDENDEEEDDGLQNVADWNPWKHAR